MKKEEFRVSFNVALSEVLTEVSERPIKDDETFASYGLDSLDVMNLFLQLEEELNVSLGEEVDPEQYNTLSKVYEFIVNEK